MWVLYRNVAQLGRAPALGAGCRRFKSCHSDILMKGLYRKYNERKSKMKKLVALLVAVVLATPVFAAEEAVQQENQKVDNNGSFLGVNFVKQPEEQGGKQLVTNKKSFLFINVVINGKPVVVQEKEAEVK